MSSNKLFDFHKPVFIPSALIIVLFIGITLYWRNSIESVFNTVQANITSNWGWFLIGCVNLFVLISIFLSFSKYGKIRLGGKNAKPDFSTFSWFAMLFSAGMGIGLLFFGVAEPIMHYHNPPIGVQDTVASARRAMSYTYLHYGLHAWAIYALVALALAFFCFNWKLPLTIRSVFYPLLGERIHGWIGNMIDVVAVFATLFGLATSLGYGVQQVSSGLNYLFEIPDNVWTQVILILSITSIATVSVVLGLDKGVRFLSVINMRLGLIFLIVILFVGPTIFIFDTFIQSVGGYVQNFFSLGTWTEGYQQTNWQHDWTVFYWAWWISWSPFVGMFIARVSKGRTIREFILGVLLVPSLLTFFWFSVFGGSALFLELNGMADIATAVNENLSTALFVTLDEYPISEITAIIGIVLVISFFVTSSDSGSLVIDSITAGGKLDAPVGQRVFWAVTEGAVAATLLIGGGLKALQTAAIVTGLPFAFLLLIMIRSLFKGLKKEYEELETRKEEIEQRTYINKLKSILKKEEDKGDE